MSPLGSMSSPCSNTILFGDYALQRFTGLCINCAERPPLDRECPCMKPGPSSAGTSRAIFEGNGASSSRLAEDTSMVGTSDNQGARPRTRHGSPPQPFRPELQRNPPSRPAVMTEEEMLARRASIRPSEATPQDPIFYHVREYPERRWLPSRPIREWTWGNDMRVRRPVDGGSRALGTSVLRRLDTTVDDAAVDAFGVTGRRLVSTDLNLPTIEELGEHYEEVKRRRMIAAAGECTAEVARATGLARTDPVWWISTVQEADETAGGDEQSRATAASDGSGTRGRRSESGRSVTWSDEVRNVETGSSRSVSSVQKSKRSRSPPPRGWMNRLRSWRWVKKSAAAKRMGEPTQEVGQEVVRTV